MKERMLVEDIKLLAIKNKGWQLDFTKLKKKILIKNIATVLRKYKR